MPAGDGVTGTLTTREREILGHLAAGRTNGEIAKARVISTKTASVHVSNILRKLDVSTRYEAARPDGHHHHHMVCDRCGDVQPFADDDLERAVDRLADRVAFAVAEHEIVLHGECAACRA